ncbi:hypothetical protein [Neptunomonas antarctica]|uniref:Uncharacterized protein n=1 Tax=Neptunomonas antarctica TaxID=619304 RepID=A0A1N7ITH6_9GAMM|nr:hypothetical protein [Neptunomonas antarctica]SIS40337.1 hypothetical protein SAMN05421760_101103 [Neptunomonas antarctica]
MSDNHSNAQPTSPVHIRVAGIILYLMILLSVASGLTAMVPSWWAGIAGWLAAMLLLRRVRRMQLLQSGLILLVGLSCLLWSGSHTEPMLWLKALSANQALVTMLAAVSFLRLIAASQMSDDRFEPQGANAFWKTLLGVHIFGAVINLSAMMIMAERLNQKQPLSLTQAVTLSRGFGTAALWSPFFAAMGVALTNAPGAHLFVLALAGLPIAAVALWIAGTDISKEDDIDQFKGYPLDLSALWMPSLLAVSIMACHFLLPRVPVLTLIALLSILLPLVILIFKRSSVGVSGYKHHIINVIPNIGSELLLFLAAGVLAVGIGSVMISANITLGFSDFGAWQASGLLIISVILAIAGVHPVITIATAGGLLATIDVAPDLLAMTFLMCWSGGVIASPLSGMHLTLSGRFNISNFKLFMRNRRFSLKFLVLQIAFLSLYDAVGVL